MKIGFTGTRYGMTGAQKQKLYELLDGVGCHEFHHGDCIGADAEAHDIAQALGIPTHVHPPIEKTHQAFCKSPSLVYPCKTHLARNRDIVTISEWLIGCPFDNKEQPRGGTWYTIRYARKQNKKLTIIYPDGSVG